MYVRTTECLTFPNQVLLIIIIFGNINMSRAIGRYHIFSQGALQEVISSKRGLTGPYIRALLGQAKNRINGTSD